MDGTFIDSLKKGLLHEPKLMDTGYGKKVITGIDSDGVSVLAQFEDPRVPEPKVMQLSTLAGIVEYVKRGLAGSTVCVHVASPTEVRVVVPVVGEQKQLLTFAIATPYIPRFTTDAYYPLEDFIIGLQTGIIRDKQREELQKICGAVKSTKTADIKDDGVSQSVTVQESITRDAVKVVKDEWILRAKRTFPELEQPETLFVFRMRTGGVNGVVGVNAALFESDGGAWRVEAIASIGAYLKEQLPDTVILA